MSKRITIIDYGLGNIFSVANAVTSVGFNGVVVSDVSQLEKGSPVILPGVGAFAAGMEGLQRGGWVDKITSHVKDGGFLLGICLGMQLLFDSSTEMGHHRGLGLLTGPVTAVPAIDVEHNRPHRIPHTGWNRVLCSSEHGWRDSILASLSDGTYMYFVHSFSAHPGLESIRVAHTMYGGHRLTAVVQSDNIMGCQFHPEKSGLQGLQVLQNYCRLAYRH